MNRYRSLVFRSMGFASRHRRPCMLLACVLLLAAGALLGQAPRFMGIKLLNNGNVGIGTETPKTTLHVVGPTTLEGDLTLTGALQGSEKYQNAAVLGGMFVNGGANRGKDFNLPVPQFVLRYNRAAAVRVGVSPIEIWSPNYDPDAAQLKNFIISNPTDAKKYLVHATLEGPEGAVYYRGSAQLRNGRVEIELPHYFEALTRSKGRTIQLTTIDGFDPITVLSQGGEKIKNGRFIVVSNNHESKQAFDWEVKAIRADAPELEVEPSRDKIAVGGFGPYTFVAKER